jgi:cyclophilin family peptidyl-prolyl cis-trans isomerase
MRPYGRITVSLLTMVTLLAAAGCGSKSDATQPSPAAIGGDAAKTATDDANAKAKAAEERLHPVVAFDTSLGKITVRLDGEKAPLTVSNFIAHVNTGQYKDTIFHQVFKGQCVLGGGYTADMTEKPCRDSVRNEAHNGLKNRRGTIAMVRSPDAIDSATCQFYFNVADNAILDHKDRTPEGYGYCVFGEVTEGLDVLDKIASVPVEDTSQFERKPTQPIPIKSVYRVQ